jgi:hypothetical protein
MWKGDTKLIVVPVLDEEGAPVNLTGSSIKWKMTDGIETLEKSTTGGGIEISTEETNEFTVKIDPADTEDFIGFLYDHEAEVTDENSDVITVLTGQIVLKYAIITDA